MSTITTKGAIQPIFKSLRLRRLKNKDSYKDGLKLTSNLDVGITFPFERTPEDIAEGIKTILGYTYGRKVFSYWSPKYYKIREFLFLRKSLILKNTEPKDVTTILPALRAKTSTFRKRVKKNFIYDHTEILNMLFPNFNDTMKWNSPRAYKNIESFIEQWLRFITDDNNPTNSDILKCEMAMYDGTIKSMHDKIVVGIRINGKSSNLTKYVDPTVNILRTAKVNLDNYIPLYILRSIICGKLNIKEFPKELQLYNLIKDYTFVFYNDTGLGFIINTMDDPEFSNYKGTTLITRLRMLYKALTSMNNMELDNSEFDILEEDEVVLSNNDLHQDILSEDKDLDDIIDTLVNSDRPLELSKDNPLDAKLMKMSKVEDPDDTIEFNDDDDEELVEDIIEDDIPEEEEEDEIDTDMLDPEDGEGDNDNSANDIKDLIATIERDNKPTKTEAQIKRLNLIKDKYKSIVVDGRSIEQILADKKVREIDNFVPNIKVMDKSIKGSTLVDMENSYVSKTMEYDIINTMVSFANDKSINLHLVDMVKEDTSDLITGKFTYTFKFVDDKDKTHHIKIDIPKVDEDGFLFIGGNRKVLKKQLTLLPVVKTKPDLVMISSNYNKCFMFRHGDVITKGVSSLLKLLNRELSANDKFKSFKGSNEKSNSKYLTNIEYDVFSAKYHRFIIGGNKPNNCEITFSQDELRKTIKEKFPTYKIQEDQLPIGINWKTNTVITISLKGDGKSVTETIFDMIDEFKVVEDIYNLVDSYVLSKRRMYSKLELQSRDYATIAFLGGLYTLTKVINTEKIPVEFSDVRLRNDHRLYVKFKDGYLYYKDTNIAASLLMNGLSYMNCEDYSIADFDTEKPYIEYFFSIAKSRNVYKGHTAFKDLFIDKITEEVLKDLDLPTDFLELFLYANSLLADNSYTSETDLSNYRIRGYENISVILYKAMASQYRLYKQNSAGTGRISLQQDQVMVGLHKSFILENHDDTNPMNELKTKSIVTFKGPGGVNNDRVFTLEKRAYGKSAIGIIAISSVDNGGVGIVKQITTNPNIMSTRGYLKTCKNSDEANKMGLGQMASPEEADAPFANYHDDPKRIGFVSGQTKHIIKVRGATSPVIGSGIEKTSAFMVGNSYVPKAKKDGVVESIDMAKNIAILRHDDGTKTILEFGKKLIRNSAIFFQHELVLNVKLNQKFKVGDILAYEAEFYKKDVFGNVRGSQSVLAKLALHEKSSTEEDSSVITSRFGEKLTTTVVLRKQISLSKDANLISYKNLGDHVLKGDSLIIFEDSGDDATNELMNSLGDVSEEILAMAKQSPKANATGEIVDIKVYFTRPLEEYSDSLFKFIDNWSKAIKAKLKFTKANGVESKNHEMMINPTKPIQAGRDARINGAIISGDGGVLIEYYIAHETGMGVGDKMTFSAQIKSVVAQVIPEGNEPVTEDGVILDGVMGLGSLSARMCYSPLMQGVLAHCLVERSKAIAKEFLGL